MRITNCNFFRNNGYAINMTGEAWHLHRFNNNAFGSGSEENASGQINGDAFRYLEEDSVTFPSDETPWADPENGDFTIVHTSAKGAGRGEFPPGSSFAAYPDIGAAQHEDVGGVSQGLQSIEGGVCA
jgi:hypothetical protein